MGWHSDDEPELGPDPVIASLSLGAVRDFRVRRRRRPAQGRNTSWKRSLGHGSLFLMEAGFQQLYQHALPRTKKETGLRINLTFRQIAS
jgi:alkylated DNA repair dioxygenase AlkB